ncbi:hypothetical protein [Acidicapsa ligni]|uniref:hypothetical protein n=1 Tax=Acidicapsa ligni TaxID=542300 RepID=UPI0021DF6B9C|nr:hypothetical protein [Acidicapsa ligni]
MNNNQPGQDEAPKTQSDGHPSQKSNTQVSPNKPDAGGAQDVSDKQVDADVKALEDRVKTGERWVIGLTGALVLVGLLQFGAGFLQWRTMKGQLKEMHDGGVDTHKLVTAAVDQATWTQRLKDSTDTQSGHMKDLADRMKDQADRTKTIAEQAVIQARAARVSAEAAKNAADTSQKAMELSERPWLIVSATIASALTYDKEGAHITLHYSIANIGHSPAVEVQISPEFYVANGKKRDAILERRRLCKELETHSALGETIYPGQVFEQNWSFSAAQIDIDNSAAYFGNEFFVAQIVDCVGYRANFSQQPYSVGSSYGLYKFSPTGETLIFPPYIEMPIGSIMLTPSGFSSKDAK